MKTIYEVENLKTDWLKDPCWDVENTEGFEDYADELKEFSDKVIAEAKIRNRAITINTQKEASAFPVIETGMDYDGTPNGDVHSIGGLSKREYFAGLAMHGILAANVAESIWSDKLVIDTTQQLASLACKHADALIAELHK